MKPSENVDTYIRSFPPNIQEILERIRETIQKAAPGAEECISYQMPAYKLNGILVYFAAAKNHIGFYPTGSGIEAFKNEFSGYKWSKGAVQFPLDQPMPIELIDRMVRFRVAVNAQNRKK
jgi:uncharacterized protein YdhG (YjbR/CyaY superfamily)